MQPNFATQIQDFIAAARIKAQDGLTLPEVFDLIITLIQIAVRAAEQLAGVDGPVKKAAVLSAVATLFDTVAPFVLLPPPWNFVAGLVLKVVRPLVLTVADGAVEAVLRKLRAHAE